MQDSFKSSVFVSLSRLPGLAAEPGYIFLWAWCRQCHPFPVVRHALLSSFGAASQMSVALTTAAAMLFLGGTIAALKAVRAWLMGVQATTGDCLRHSHTSAGCT
jgi:hypothetical protein